MGEKEEIKKLYWMARFALFNSNRTKKNAEKFEKELSKHSTKILLEIGKYARPWSFVLHFIFKDLINRPETTGVEISQFAENLNETLLSNFYYEEKNILEKKFKKHNSKELLGIIFNTKHEIIRDIINSILMSRKEDLLKMATFWK
jgi:hypothetical protein